MLAKIWRLNFYFVIDERLRDLSRLAHHKVQAIFSEVLIASLNSFWFLICIKDQQEFE